jgi:uncharacterized protein (DUF1501 family)
MDTHRSCADYTRTQLLRNAGAAALPGRGLPAIEAGMPLPAGTGLSRRSFLLRSAGVALSVYGAGRLAPEAFEEGIAQAATAGDQPVLVSVFLSGGIDSLNVLAPFEDPRYQSLRPTLALKSGTPLSSDPRLVWHPSAAPLQQLHAAGKVTVAPAMAYDRPNQSHFTSRHFYETGTLDVNARTGWLGRWLDVVGDPHNAIQGLSMEYDLSPALATSRVAVAATATPADYRFESWGVWDAPAKAAMLESFGRLGTLPSSDPITGQARQAQANAAILRNQLSTLPAAAPSVTYPGNGLGNRLKALANMLGAGLPIRVATMNAVGGYDTHSGQAGSFDRNLAATSQAIAAFQADLEARGLADRVLVHLWSEFGRRPEENGSAGTDHGAAGVGFLIGTRASGGLIGEYPGLGTLDPHGNLRATSDFRGLYASLVEGWLGGAEAADVIPGAATLPRYAVVK